MECARLSDEALARRIRADGIDVLVELNGHMFGNRLAVLAWRPAPVQVHYLGYPGTLGFDADDAIVADGIVVPPGDDVHYHERVWRLPRCYQVNDRGRGLPPRPARTTLGLADDWLVLACFNQTYKLSRAYFSIWLRALDQEPRAILWLLASNEMAQANLRAEAARAGIDPSRLVFAPKVPQDEHIARLRAADLALDVLPCGSHTTGSDALWAGVPSHVPGIRSRARRRESVEAVGLPELVESVDATRRLLRLR
jgi:predicted O-linked N-acetylglucosamine transferase (SPINDLY family)